MNDDKLRKLINDNRDGIKKLMLSDSRLKTVEWIKYVVGSVDSDDLATKEKTSLQSASTKLKKLYDMGWLTRIETKSPSGGILYNYRAVEL